MPTPAAHRKKSSLGTASIRMLLFAEYLIGLHMYAT
jgi:hypothetical protein